MFFFHRVPYLTSQPWYDKNDTMENNERARKAYTAMLTVTPKQPDDEEYTKVTDEVSNKPGNHHHHPAAIPTIGSTIRNKTHRH